MNRLGCGLAALAVLFVVAILASSSFLLGGGFFGEPNAPASSTAPSAAALADIPADMLALYEAGAKLCPGLSWTVLAGIGKVETNHGRGGEVSPAGALGPMQFMPPTFAAYHLPGEADITNPKDAIDAAARYLCANGGGNAATLSQAIFAYNHLSSYVSDVLGWAAKYASAAVVAPEASADIAGVQTVGAVQQQPTPAGLPAIYEGFPNGQCTFWVALHHPVFWSGNAADWWANAAAAGATEAQTPAIGSIVVYGSGAGYSVYGHVALVIGVSGSTIEVNEMNYLGTGLVDDRASSMADVLGFIR